MHSVSQCHTLRKKTINYTAFYNNQMTEREALSVTYKAGKTG